MKKKITSLVVTKSKYYEFTQCHYLNLTLENVDGIDPKSIVSVIINSDEENFKRNERVEILKITNPDDELIKDPSEFCIEYVAKCDFEGLKEINSNKDLRLFLYEELMSGGILDDDDDEDEDEDEDWE